MDVKKIVESLSPNELKILPHIEERNVGNICRKANLDKTSVLRALEYLQNKKLVKLAYSKKEVVELGVNGIFYRKRGLPERKLLDVLGEKRILGFGEAQKKSGLSNEEFKVSLGILKSKSLIEIKNKKLVFSANKEEISKKLPEELFVESLPLNYDSLTEEQIQLLKNLQRRKDIVKVKEESVVKIDVTDLGKQVVDSKIKTTGFIEQITPEILRNDKWKGKKFRRYDVVSSVPEISGGKRHFVNQASDYARRIWTDMGFKEMRGNIIESSFWVFDALFTAQDHPVRDMQDTFFIDKKVPLEKKEIVKAVKDSHEKGVGGSKGWKYLWSEEESRRLVLRTHTTAISSQTLANLNKEDLPAKFFALGKCFRNETVDWSHGFEFNQSEGIVVDENVNLRHLLGYLKQFFKKMGFEKIRFSPAYFPYTEPSVEINAWHPEKKQWLELGGAGIFRPEVVIPLFGEYVPVLAWGPGFDRVLMDYYKIKDIRELYKNDLDKLKEKKFWLRN